ncbi:MAG: sugar transferase [Bacteroidales bacterium]|nr:sugar transferase [Bacteroidales bacterium]
MRKTFGNKRKESFTEFNIHWYKRVFDIAFSMIALIIFFPIMLLVAILIKLDSKGPVFYISKRIGTGFEAFDFYKFRSMYTGSEEKRADLSAFNQYLKHKHNKGVNEEKEKCPECEKLGYPCSPLLYIDGNQICENFYLYKKRLHNKKATFFKVRNDPRVTRIGRVIRRLHLDELPQLFNVLKGDMSIVGNRPLPLYEAEQLTSDQWALRFLAPAGITGLWQISESSDMLEEERKNLDNKYAITASFGKDIIIILKTIPVLIRSRDDL